MIDFMPEVINWMIDQSEELFLVVGLGLGYLSQFFLDHSTARRNDAPHLRQERRKVDTELHTQRGSHLSRDARPVLPGIRLKLRPRRVEFCQSFL